METIIGHIKKRFTYNKLKVFKIIVFVGFSVFIFSACEDDYRGNDGFPGKAYLQLTWLDAEPAYLDVGNTDIPPTFYWNEYYRITPGIYTLYYEVDGLEDNYPVTYAYELVYEIWIDPGEPGDYNYNGKNGGDTYFILELTPYGPSVYGEMRYKSVPVTDMNDKIEYNGDQIIIKKVNDYWIKASYKQVKPRNI